MLLCFSLRRVCRVRWLIARMLWFGTAEMKRVNSW